MNKQILTIWLPILVTVGIIIAAVILANSSGSDLIYGSSYTTTATPLTKNYTSLHVTSSQCQKLTKGNNHKYFGEASGEVVNKSDRTLRMDEWVKVYVTWQDASGKALYTSSSFIDVHSLLPEASSTWSIDDSSFWNIKDGISDKNMAEPSNCVIHFEVFDIVVTPSFDSKTIFFK